VRYPWYELVDGNSPLDQGDLLFDCPVVFLDEQRFRSSPGEGFVSKLRETPVIASHDVVVMTQACDLRNQKVAHVILCPHYSLSIYEEEWKKQSVPAGQNPTDKGWKRHLDRICDGRIWNLTMLNQEEVNGYRVNMRIVDFHEIFSLPISVINLWLAELAQPRVRLRPPYREHLSQAFARFFMRVGLPIDIQRSW